VDKELSDSNSSLRDLRADIMKSCFNALDAMQGWEHVLGQVLDGDMFAGIHSHHQSSGAQGFGQGVGGSFNSQFPPRSLSSSSFLQQPSHSRLAQYTSSDAFSPDLAVNAQSLSQAVAVSVERVGLRVHRLQQLRQLFESQAERMSRMLSSKLDGSQERVNLCLLRVAEAGSKVEAARVVVDRDNRQKTQEAQEMKRFREEVLRFHKYNTL
jgi:hypothetical protein